MLQMGNYAENWKGFKNARPQKQADGSFVMRRPFVASTRLDYVAARHDTAQFVKALVDLPAGTKLLGVSEVRKVFGLPEDINSLFVRDDDGTKLFGDLGTSSWCPNKIRGGRSTRILRRTSPSLRCGAFEF